MAQNTNRQQPVSSDAPMVGDHLAMDLLNTQVQGSGELVDYWTTGADVLAWLVRYGIVAPVESGPVDEQVLLAQAKALRAVALDMLTRRKRGESFDLGALNAYLDGYLSAPRLLRSEAGALVLARVSRGGAISALLGPVAEAVAELLVDGDFALVRQCEHPECILWFYDRTKGHKRRWCSMAVCGNRHKAAQFRKRNSEGAPSQPG